MTGTTTSFTDTKGRTWDLTLTIGTIKRVKNTLGIDILAIEDGQFLVDLSRDVWKLVDMVYVIIKPQADAQGVSDEDFGEALGGEALANASDAFLLAVENFFHQFSPPIGETLAKLRQKLEEMEEKSLEMTRAKLDDPRLGQAMEKNFQKMDRDMEAALGDIISGSGPTNSPESSDSTRQPGLSGS